MTIGERVRRIREALRLSQQDAATEADISLRTLQYIEGDQKDPTLKTLRKLAGYFGLSASVLIADDDELRGDYAWLARLDRISNGEVIARLESIEKSAHRPSAALRSSKMASVVAEDSADYDPQNNSDA